MRKHVEEFALDVECHHLRREAKKEFVGAVAVVFGQSRNGDRQLQFAFHHLAHYVHLPNATIRDDEIWQRCLLLYHATVTATHHFLHRSVVVRPRHRADIILPIVPFRGLHALENHASCHGIAARNIAIIEAFYLIRQLR